MSIPNSGVLHPSGYFANCVLDHSVAGSGGIFIPYANFASYDTNTKEDVRELVWSVVDRTYQVFNAMSDRPDKMTITKTSEFPSETQKISTYRLITYLDVANAVFDVSEETIS